MDSNQCINLKFANLDKHKESARGQTAAGASLNMTYHEAASKNTEMNRDMQQRCAFTLEDRYSGQDQVNFHIDDHLENANDFSK